LDGDVGALVLVLVLSFDRESEWLAAVGVVVDRNEDLPRVPLRILPIVRAIHSKWAEDDSPMLVVVVVAVVDGMILRVGETCLPIVVVAVVVHVESHCPQNEGSAAITWEEVDEERMVPWWMSGRVEETGPQEDAYWLEDWRNMDDPALVVELLLVLEESDVTCERRWQRFVVRLRPPTRFPWWEG
jgi:hypothetical protein